MVKNENNEKECNVQKEQKDLKTNWKSMYMLTAFCFFDGFQYSMFIVSLWPYLNTIDPTAGPTFFGIITAGFSFGQAIGSPVLGFWMNRVKSIKPPMSTGLTIQVVSNAVFALIEFFVPTHRRYIMLISRILVGFGSGNVAVMRTYAANASVPKDRARAITMIAASWTCGITVGPAIQVAFAPLGYPGTKIFGDFHLDMYTAPPLLASFIDIIVLISLNLFVKEEYVGVNDNKKEEDPNFMLPKPKLLPIIVCIVTRFTLMFTITNAEAIGSMFTMAMYDWNDEQAVKYNGLIMLGQSGVALAVNIIFTVYLADYVSNGKERITAILGLSIGLFYHLITYTWPFFPNKPGYSIEGSMSNGTTEIIGCYSSKYSWCPYTHQVPLWLYAFATVLVLGLALHVTFIPLNTLFSKILGDRRQGTMTGIFFTSGSIARTIGPIVVAIMFKNYGPAVTWVLPIIMLVVTIVLWIVCYKFIVPLDANSKLKIQETIKIDEVIKTRF